MNHMSKYQRAYMDYIARNPGCCIADVDRACMINPLAGHAQVDGRRESFNPSSISSAHAAEARRQVQIIRGVRG